MTHTVFTLGWAEGSANYIHLETDGNFLSTYAFMITVAEGKEHGRTCVSI